FRFRLETGATYYKHPVDNSAENRAFKTSARQIFFDSETEDLVDEKFAKFFSEQ
ncbi:Hypothetical protein CINCED_3A019946, partial [Cinara cedri]